MNKFSSTAGVSKYESSTELIGESILYSQERTEEVRLKDDIQPGYRNVEKFKVTTHRLLYTDGGEDIALHLNLVIRIEVRGGLMNPKKLLLTTRSSDSEHKFHLRTFNRGRFDELVRVIQESLRAQAWLKTEGFVPRAIIGGVSRVVRKLNTEEQMHSEVVDSGLVDLQSLKANARILQDLIDSLKREATDINSAGALRALLQDYGLGETGESHPKGTGNLMGLVESAISASNGVILIHDLFCLINRKLKLEKIYSPRQFLKELQSMSSSLYILEISRYKIVMKIKLHDLNAMVVGILKERQRLGNSDISLILKIGNPRVVSLLLTRIEETYGNIVKDGQADPDPEWYLNNFL